MLGEGGGKERAVGGKRADVGVKDINLLLHHKGIKWGWEKKD